MTSLILLFFGVYFLFLGIVFFAIRRAIIAPEVVVFATCSMLGFLSSWVVVDYSALSSFAVLIFFVGALLLGISAFLFSGGVVISPMERSISFASPKLFEGVILVAAWISVILLLGKAFELSKLGPFDSILMNLRWQVSSPKGQGFGGWGYIKPFLTVVALRQVVWFSHSSKVFRKKSLIFLAYFFPGFLAAFVAMGRGHVVGFLVAVIACFVLVRRHVPIGGLVGIFGLSLLFYSGLGFLLGKINTEAGLFLAILSSMGSYFVKPLLAWAHVFNDLGPFTWGDYSFRFLYAIINSFGVFNVQVVSNVREFVVLDGGGTTNIFTFVYPYYKDFGVVGVVALPVVVGAIVGTAFRGALKWRSPAWIIIYSLTIMPLFSIFGGERFLLLTSQWIQYFFWSFVLTFGWRACLNGRPIFKDCI